MNKENGGGLSESRVFAAKQNGSVRGADIAAELHVSRPTVSVSLKELEKEGYLFLDGARVSASDR